MKRASKERAIHLALFGVAAVSIIVLALIAVFLFWEGLPLFGEISVVDFLFGQFWYPTYDPPEFGVFPLVLATLAVAAVSGSMAIPLGVMTAIYLAEIAGPAVREFFKPVVELLAALPSVVIGFFGMVLVAPFLQDTLNVLTGLNLFNAALMLAFMSIPTICSIAEDAIRSVPQPLRDASLALGATRLETILRVVIPAAISGISTAVILGLSRAIGETMVVLMVAGGAAIIPVSLFDPVRPLPATIAAEMAETPVGSPHYHALFTLGIVLFLFTLIFNLAADHLAQRYRQVGDASL
jgi:phosphate transport system permease protein